MCPRAQIDDCLAINYQPSDYSTKPRGSVHLLGGWGGLVEFKVGSRKKWLKRRRGLKNKYGSLVIGKTAETVTNFLSFSFRFQRSKGLGKKQFLIDRIPRAPQPLRKHEQSLRPKQHFGT